MKICPKCSTPLNDDAKFCATCGTSFAPAAGTPAPEQQSNAGPNPGGIPFNNGSYGQPYGQQPSFTPQPPIPADPFDHTDEFDAKDISDNKVIAMLLYLMGVAGVLIALLSQNSSPYVAFHLRQALKFMVVNSLLGFAAVVLSWTFIVPIVCAVAIIVLAVVKIICFVDICKGKAREPAIIRTLDFLK